MPRERVTIWTETWLVTRRFSRGRLRTHCTTARAQSKTQYLRATTRRTPAATRCTSFGSHGASFNTHHTSALTPRARQATPLAPGATLSTCDRRSDLRGYTLRTSCCTIVTPGTTLHASPITSLAPAKRRCPRSRTSNARRAPRFSRSHTNRVQPDTQRTTRYTSSHSCHTHRTR